MSKVTVITGAKGQIQVIGHGHLSEATSRKRGAKEFPGGIRELPGQRLHEIEVEHDLKQIKTWKELVEKVRPHIKAA
jgi:hypothetical protein